MNIHFEQAEKKSQLFFYMVLVLVFILSALIINTRRTANLHLSVPFSSSEQPVYGESNNVPVAIPAPLPPAGQVQTTPTPVAAVTPGPLPQAVAVPVPNLP